MAPIAPRVLLPLIFTAQCKCGKVKCLIHALDTSPPLRLVCYCQDCRGYYETLNRMADTKAAVSKDSTPPAPIDNWGGVDWTAMYPRDITISHGQEHLTTVKIREKSIMRQVHTTCCQTPMFRFGQMSALVNSHVLVPVAPEGVAGDAVVDDKANKNTIPIQFRIVGRQGWKQGANSDLPKPQISYSIPFFRWLWTMPFRIDKKLMEPMPMKLPTVDDCEVLKDFKEASRTPPSNSSSG